MKKILLLNVIFSIFYLSSIAQSIPQGINYQAVARNNEGSALVNKALVLKINLQDPKSIDPTVFYSETHHVFTNQLGLFSVVVGEGSALSGNFYSIPWSNERIWMEIYVMSEADNDFTKVSTSELMAVPYAFHAETATAVSGTSGYTVPGSSAGGTTVNAGPVPATAWETPGNSASNPLLEYIGTGDLKDLLLNTNGIERLKIFSTGNINITNSLTIGIDLTVGRDVTVNHDVRIKNDAVIDSNLIVKKNVMLNGSGGSTMNYGPFTVNKVSPTVLTGTLRVDQITNLNDSLRVNNLKPTLLTGTLRVNKETSLNNSLTVNNQSSTVMTGTLRVDSNVTFNNRLLIDNANFNSTDSSNGALVVAGGVGIGKNINVGGDLKVSGSTGFAGQLKLNDPRPSIRPDSGALVVSGGVGIGKQISVGGYTHLYDSLRVEGDANFRKTVTVTDSAAFQNKLRVTGVSTLNGSTDVTGAVTVNGASLVNADQSLFTNYPLQVQGGMQGIAVQVSGNKAMANNYSSFFDQSGMQGRIEGLAAGEYSLTADYAQENKRLNDDVYLNELNIAFATLNEVQAGIKLGAALISTTPCVGLGVCATVPIPSFIVASLVNFAAATAILTVSGVQLDQAYTAKSDFDASSITKNGITYESGAGDYAEYLEMANKDEKIFPGDIVGMKGGKISRITEGNDRIMVASVRPIVLGNMPKDGIGIGYKKIAFLGQVPVKVIGKVSIGDFILPDGNNLGLGKAFSSEELLPSQKKEILGVAWSASETGKTISTINVAVGLNMVDNHKEIEELQNEISELNNQIAASDRELENLFPAYKDANAAAGAPTASNQPYLVTPTPENINYKMVSRAEMVVAFDQVIAQMNENKNDKNSQIFLKKIKSDPAFLESTIDKAMKKIEKVIEVQKELDKKLSK